MYGIRSYTGSDGVSRAVNGLNELTISMDRTEELRCGRLHEEGKQQMQPDLPGDSG